MISVLLQLYFSTQGVEKTAAERAGVAVFSTAAPLSRVAAGRRIPGWLCRPRKPSSARTWLPYPSNCTLTLLKQSWSSWEQFLVWDWIQFVAVCFLEIGPASVLVISPLHRSCLPAHRLPPGLRPLHALSFLWPGIASAPTTATSRVGVWVGENNSEGAFNGNARG